MHDEGTGTGAYWTGAFFVAGSLAFRPQFKLHADEPYVRPMDGFKVPRDSPLVA